MFLKTLIVTTPVAFGILFYSGALGGGYSRDIGRPMPEVLRALEGADIRREPGTPGTEPTGGVMPAFQMTHTDHSVTWTVTSGDKVATTMTATLAPINEGKGTRVTTEVVKGDADPDYVSPLFRSKSMTKAVFAAMVESELNELTAANSRLANGDAGPRDRTLFKGIQTVMQVHAAYGEYERTGKDPFADDKTRIEAAERANGDYSPPAADAAPRNSDGVNFTPGKPMIDVSKYNR